MRYNKLLLTFLFLQLFFVSDAQQWYEIQSATWTLKQIQDSFYRTHSQTNVGGQPNIDEDERHESDELFKRWESFWLQRMKPEDHFPSLSATYEAWENYIKTHPPTVNRGQSQANWTFKGPQTSPGGYNGLGKINCMKFHPTDSNTFWIGSANGGLWKTTTGGTTWSTVPGSITNSAINDIAINPVNPNIMYMTTMGIYGGTTRNVGLVKSADGGITWDTTGLTYKASDYVYFYKVIIFPNNPSMLLVSASNGIWKSNDAGNSWTLIHPITSYGIDLKLNPANPSIVYASTYSFSGGQNAQIWRSVDAGSTWSAVAALPGAGRTLLAVTPDNPSLVMSLSPLSTGGLYGLWKSTDNGATFNFFFQGNNTNNLLSYSANGTGTDGQGGYCLAFCINPNNKNDVWVGGINTWNSKDNGLTWNIKNHWTGDGGLPTVHADKHFLAFNTLAPGTIYECNDGGIYKSSDDGLTWTDLSNGLGISQIYKVSTAQTATNKILCGLQDNGTKMLTGQNWRELSGGDGFKCIMDYADTSIFYTSFQSGNIYRWANSGATVNAIVSGYGSGVNGPSSFRTNFTMHPTDHNILLVGKSEVYQTTNGGFAWNPLGSIASPYQSDEWAITIAPSNTQIIYAGQGQYLYKTINGGSTWTTTTLPASYVNNIVVDPLNPQKIWVSCSYNIGGIWKSTDGGATFNNFRGSIPAGIGINCVVYENGSKETLYVGTDIGVFYRDSTMNDWTYFNDGLPNIVVNDLQISYTTHTIWAGTYGRGLWSSDLFTPLPLSLLDFTAKIEGKTTSLQWHTAKEVNTNEFEIQRSADGIEWIKIGAQKAQNTNGTHFYTFIDQQPINGKNYFRLKMTDIDNRFTYSPVRTVNFTGNNLESIQITPNPAGSFTNILFPMGMIPYQLRVYDAWGKLIVEKMLYESLIKSYRLETGIFSSGTYMVQVKSNRGLVCSKLIVGH